MSQGAGTRPLRPSCILTKSKVHANSYILKLKQLHLCIIQKHLNKKKKKKLLGCSNDCAVEQVRHYYSKLTVELRQGPAVKAQRTKSRKMLADR